MSLLLAGSLQADLIIVTGPTDVFGAIGDYTSVTGNNNVSSPGQVLEVLGGVIGGAAKLQNIGSESGTHTINMGDLFQVLSDGGIVSTTALVFGFGLNETGATGTNWVDITALDMSFERARGGTDAFSLDSGGDNTIRVFNYVQGQDLAEARIRVDLGFDFMAEYSKTRATDLRSTS